jgi:hypothetical protein
MRKFDEKKQATKEQGLVSALWAGNSSCLHWRV